MENEFNKLLRISIQTSRNKFFGSLEEFQKNVEIVKERLLKAYEENPDATEEDIKEEIEDFIEKISKETITLKDFRSDILRRNAIQYLQKNPSELENEYKRIIESERKSGKQVICPDIIIYNSNRKKAVRQVIIEILAGIRMEMSELDSRMVEIIKYGDINEIEKLKKKLVAKNPSRQDRKATQRVINIIRADSEFERVKYDFKETYDLEITDKELKEDLVQAILKSVELLGQFTTIDTYFSRQNFSASQIGIEQFNLDPNKIFEEEYLKRQGISKLVALYAFWNNRLVKETIKFYKTYYMMYEFGLDKKENLVKENVTQEITEDDMELLRVKTALLNIKATELFNKYRKRNERSVVINDDLEQLTKIYGEEYKKYFMKIGGFAKTNNDLEDDFTLYLGYENTVKNLYEQKDYTIIGMLDLLYNGNISTNWGIIEEDKKSQYVLIGADIEGLNMPLRLHIKKDIIKKYIKDSQENTLIPVYAGKEDFVVGRRYLATYALAPLDKEQIQKIQQANQEIRKTDYRAKTIRHLNFLTNTQNFPEHLQQERTVIKKGKPKTKFERTIEFLDLETGEKYIQGKDEKIYPKGGEEGR